MKVDLFREVLFKMHFAVCCFKAFWALQDEVVLQQSTYAIEPLILVENKFIEGWFRLYLIPPTLWGHCNCALMSTFCRSEVEEIFKDCMNECAAFGIDAWWFWKLLDHAIFVESRTVIKFAHSAGGEANVSHIRDHTLTPEQFLT